MRKSITTLKKIIKNYRWNSIFFHYFKLLFFIVFLPLITVSIILYYTYFSTSKSNMLLQVEQNAKKCTTKFEDILSDISEAYFALSTNPDAMSFMTTKNFETITKNNYTKHNNIKELFTYCTKLSPLLDSVVLYSPINNYTYSSKNSGYLEKSVYKETLKPFLEEQKHVYTISNNIAGTPYVTFGYSVIISGTPKGCITINVKSDDLTNALCSNKNECVYIVDSDNNIIFSGKENKKTDLEKILENGQDKIYSQKGFLSYTHNYLQGIRLVYIYDSQDLDIFSKSIIKTGIILFVLTLFVSFLFSLYTSLYIYKSLLKIMTALQVSVSEDSKSNYDEIEFITQNIMNILKTNEDIENKLVNNLTKLSTAQTTALQLQINPHFIFNTLNLVSVIIMDTVKQDNDAQKVIGLLSSFLRDVLNSEEKITTVKKEIENVKKYVDIELIKNKNIFDISWDVAEETLNLKTIKLILQPIVENALTHGIKPIEDFKGKIHIEVKILSDDLIINVNNNGAKIEKEKLKEIRQNLKFNDIPNKHIGLYNVNQRIKIIYGENYGCYITSSENSTTVTVKQPINS